MVVGIGDVQRSVGRDGEPHRIVETRLGGGTVDVAAHHRQTVGRQLAAAGDRAHYARRADRANALTGGIDDVERPVGSVTNDGGQHERRAIARPVVVARAACAGDRYGRSART